MAGKGFFRNEEGERSSMRLVWAFISITVISIWAIISVHNWKVETIGYDLTSLLVLLSGSKVAQTMVEKGDLSLKVGKNNPTELDPNQVRAIIKKELKDTIRAPKDVEVE